jgi:hypothetical protein
MQRRNELSCLSSFSDLHTQYRRKILWPSLLFLLPSSQTPTKSNDKLLPIHNFSFVKNIFLHEHQLCSFSCFCSIFRYAMCTRISVHSC